MYEEQNKKTHILVLFPVILAKDFFPETGIFSQENIPQEIFLEVFFPGYPGNNPQVQTRTAWTIMCV